MDTQVILEAAVILNEATVNAGQKKISLFSRIVKVIKGFVKDLWQLIKSLGSRDFATIKSRWKAIWVNMKRNFAKYPETKKYADQMSKDSCENPETAEEAKQAVRVVDNICNDLEDEIETTQKEVEQAEAELRQTKQRAGEGFVDRHSDLADAIKHMQDTVYGDSNETDSFAVNARKEIAREFKEAHKNFDYVDQEIDRINDELDDLLSSL